MKISAVQLQPFLHNDPFLLKCHLITYRDDGAIKICTISLSFITETAKGSKFFLSLSVTSLPYLLRPGQVDSVAVYRHCPHGIERIHQKVYFSLLLLSSDLLLITSQRGFCSIW